VLGLESHTFDIGNAKYSAKYKKTVDAIANYIQREYKGGADIAKAIKALSLPTLQVPGYPKAKAGETAVDPGDVYIWQQDVAAVKKQIVQLEENKKRAYALVIGQCSPDLDSKLQGSAAFVQAEADQDVVKLLLVIRGYCCRFDDHQQSTYALEQAKHRVSTYYQAHNVTNTEYVEHFKALVGVVETYGGAYCREPGLVAAELVAQGTKPKDVDTADHKAIIKAEEVCREGFLSCMLLHGDILVIIPDKAVILTTGRNASIGPPRRGPCLHHRAQTDKHSIARGEDSRAGKSSTQSTGVSEGTQPDLRSGCHQQDN
jgi:hypothetical protein